jgi:UDP-N-acetyl-D-mannosaminuronate dehydrogenase
MIHSTVDVGTTRLIFEHMGAPICHSPVMGIHPNLTKSILTFEKILGCINTEHVTIARTHLEDAGIKVRLFSAPENSEAAKLLDTTYYGWNIMYMKDVYKFCEQYQLDFNEVYKETNEIYNEGYKKLDMQHVMRPILKYIPQKIGGHCVIPNCRIIHKYFYPAQVIIDKDNNDN